MSKKPIERRYPNRTVFHLTIKATGEHGYYGSLKAIYEHNDKEVIGIALPTLYEHNFSASPYENTEVKITKGILKTPRTKKSSR